MILHEAAILSGEHIAKRESKSARWIATDALRELRNERTISMIKKRKRPS